MSFHISLSLTLLALVAGMYLLAKTRAENLGRWFSFVSYLVVIVSGLLIAGQLICGAWMFACHVGICPPSENCPPGMMMHRGMGMHEMSGSCRMESGREEEGYESRGHCEEMSGCNEMSGHHGDCCRGGEGKNGCMKDGKSGHEKKGECMTDHDSDKTK